MRFLALVIVLSTAVVVDVSPNQQAVVTPEAVIAQLHAGHPVRAAQLADSLVEHDPRSALSNALYGLAALRSTEFPKAIAALRRAIDLDPMSAEANLGLGLIDFGRGRFADAERRFRIAAESEAFKGEAFHWLGLCLAEQRRFDEAAAASEMALPYLQYYPHVQRFNLESRVTFFRILAPLSIVDIPSEFTSTEIPITPADGLLNVDLPGQRSPTRPVCTRYRIPRIHYPGLTTGKTARTARTR